MTEPHRNGCKIDSGLEEIHCGAAVYAPQHVSLQSMGNAWRPWLHVCEDEFADGVPTQRVSGRTGKERGLGGSASLVEPGLHDGGGVLGKRVTRSLRPLPVTRR